MGRYCVNQPIEKSLLQIQLLNNESGFTVLLMKSNLTRSKLLAVLRLIDHLLYLQTNHKNPKHIPSSFGGLEGERGWFGLMLS
jgi:hypothetical protein